MVAQGTEVVCPNLLGSLLAHRCLAHTYLLTSNTCPLPVHAGLVPMSPVCPRRAFGVSDMQRDQKEGK